VDPWAKEDVTEGGVEVVASQDLALDAEQKDVSMAVDMEIARREAVFVGNVVSLLSNGRFLGVVAHLRNPVVHINE
jgi:hypothetical protein